MKFSFLRAFFLLLVSGLALCFTAGKIWADTDLDKSMKELGGAYKELSTDLKQPQDASKDQYLALAAKMKQVAKAAHDMVPKLAKTLPDDQRDAMVQSYRKDMDKFMTDIDSLSDVLKDSKWDDARKLMDTLKQDMASGHKQYRAHHDKPGQPGQPPAPQPAPSAQSEPPPPAPAPSAPAPAQ